MICNPEKEKFYYKTMSCKNALFFIMEKFPFILLHLSAQDSLQKPQMKTIFNVKDT